MKNLLVLTALIFLSASAFGQKANFSGSWKLNEQESKLGYQFSLAPKSLNVVHAKKTLDLNSTGEWNGREIENRQHFTLDGKECENAGPLETVTRSTASYDRKTKILKITTRGTAEGMDYTLEQLMSLREDQLVIESEARSEMGSMYETFVFDKN